MFLFFSHKLTSLQIEDAKKNLGVDEFIYLNDELQELFSNIPPKEVDLGEYLKPLFKFLIDNCKSGDYVLIQGEFGVVYRLVELSKILDLVPLYSTTKRESIEEIFDGKVIKKSVFSHIEFRKYEKDSLWLNI